MQGVVVVALRCEAEGVVSVELRSVDRRPLRSFSAGAHVDVMLPNGLIRSYSLVNDPAERHRYVLAVKLGPASRGGSSYVHRSLRPGDRLSVSDPRNMFRLEEGASQFALIGGGIGITPLWCMAQRLSALGKKWRFHYSARTPAAAPFLPELRELAARASAPLQLAFTGVGHAEPRLDMPQIVGAAGAETHLYCCGPSPMVDAFQRAAGSARPELVHVERFRSADSSPLGGFSVVLARSGLTIDVPRGKTVLDALLDNGFDPPHACTAGVCGACEVAVLQGVPDHRDTVLSAERRKTNAAMMICCSGSRSKQLVIDL